MTTRTPTPTRPERPLRRTTSANLDAVENTGVAILNRVVQPDTAKLTADAAQVLLSLKFERADERRMEKLAVKAQQGTLTAREQSEAEQYNLVSHMLALLQAKARHALTKTRTASGIA